MAATRSWLFVRVAVAACKLTTSSPYLSLFSLLYLRNQYYPMHAMHGWSVERQEQELLAADGAFHIITSDLKLSRVAAGPLIGCCRSEQLIHASSTSIGQSSPSYRTRNTLSGRGVYVVNFRVRFVFKYGAARSRFLSMFARRCRQCRGSGSTSLLKHKRQVLENAFQQFFHCSRVELAAALDFSCSIGSTRIHFVASPLQRLAGRLFSSGCHAKAFRSTGKRERRDFYSC